MHSKLASSLVRMTAVMAMCLLKALIGLCWCFCISLDTATVAIGESLLNVQVTVPVSGRPCTFHLAALPVNVHDAARLATEVRGILDSLAETWRLKLLGISSDGASVFFGHDGGVTALLGEEAEAPFFVLWCGAHMCDLCISDSILSCAMSGHFDPRALGLLQFTLALESPVR
eukprot:GHVU01130992.1.p1 GENE.GHVU01130992.1~~GHVU01130992.1.p1  ORF type:complete len:181 (+),score=3.23 GHVU01130992.1:25-543(+)